MNISRMRHLITIERLTEKADDYGQAIKTWVKLADAYAEIRPLKGTEAYNEKEVHTEHTHKIYCRYFYMDLNATMRIKFQDVGRVRYFDVDGDPSNFLERDISWLFSVNESFEHDDEVETL